MTRLTNDVTQVQEAIVMILRMMVRAPLLLVGSLVMGILTAPRLAFLPLILMPIELAALAWIVARATPLFTRVQERLDRLNETTQENLAGVRVVKAFVRADHEERRFGDANERLADTTIGAGRTVAVTLPFMMMTMNLGVIGVLWFAGVRVGPGRDDRRPDHLVRELPDHRALLAHDGEPARHPAGEGHRVEPAHPGGLRDRARHA